MLAKAGEHGVLASMQAPNPVCVPGVKSVKPVIARVRLQRLTTFYPAGLRQRHGHRWAGIAPSEEIAAAIWVRIRWEKVTVIFMT